MVELMILGMILGGVILIVAIGELIVRRFEE
jgi:hypothetical protein